MRRELIHFRPDALRCESALKGIDAATRTALDTPESLRAAVDVVRREGQHLDHYPKMALLRALTDPLWQAALEQAAPDEGAVRALFTEIRARPSSLDRYPMLRAALGNLACLSDADAKRAACVQSAQGPSNPLTGAIGVNAGAEALCGGQWLVDKSLCVMKAYSTGAIQFPKA